MANTNNYIKLPNQGNINSNLRLLYEMQVSCDYADSNGYFTKGDIAEIAANALLVTTSSKVGSDVLGTIRNADIDEGDNSPLQNTKMRMQILRILGLVSADYNSEIYAITELGELMVSDKITAMQKRDLLRELFICIASSSEAYDFTCSEGFHCFLGLEICYAFSSLDYMVAVDEMPIITTYDYREIDDFITKVKLYREQNIPFQKTDVHFPRTNKGNPLAQPANLTRTINQILRQCNIIKSKPQRIGKRYYYVCSDEGKSYVDRIKTLWTNRRIALLTPFQFRKERILSQVDYCKQGLDNILIRANIVNGEGKHDTGLLFSPYQMLPETTVSWLLGKKLRSHPERVDTRVQAINSSLTARDLRLKAIYEKNASNHIAELAENEVLVRKIMACTSDEERSNFVSNQVEIHRNDDKYSFYPYVHSLLRIMGLDCKGEVGRYDAISVYKRHHIPVEIKSPTEEYAYNQKGIRQGIENKICAFNPSLSDDMEYASLVVGYTHPINDSEIKNLINAAYEQLKIKIIATDLKGLLNICVNIISNNMLIELDELLKGYGIIIE